MLLKNCRYLDKYFNFTLGDIRTNGVKLSTCQNDESVDEALDCSGFYVIPGLIDIHTHGALGYDHLDASIEGEEKISNFMLSHGITSYLATVMTQSNEKMTNSLKNIKKYRSEQHSGAKIAGVYLEGPYFSYKYKGAQNQEYIRKPDKNEFELFFKDSGECIKIVSLAPEIDGAMDFIGNVSKYVTVAVGHTDSDYETGMQAVNYGASDFTHTFNGMRGLHHRNPNTVGAAFDSDAYCECICDGIHIHPAIIRTLYKVKGPDKMILISDSISPAGLEDGIYSSGGLSVTVKNGKAYLDGDVLAGSTTNLLDCVKNVVSFGIPLNEAVKMATANPAKAAGLYDEIGSIEDGKNADLLILDNDLNIEHIIQDGILIK